MYGLGLAVLTWVMTSFQMTTRARLPCLVTILVGVAVERQVSYLEKVLGYNGLIFWCRTLVLLVLLWHLRQAKMSYIDLEKRNHKLINEVVDNCVLNTPQWFKKYRDA